MFDPPTIPVSFDPSPKNAAPETFEDADTTPPTPKVLPENVRLLDAPKLLELLN